MATMRIVYLKTHDGNEPGAEGFAEISLGRRLCAKGAAVPFATWEKQRAEVAAMENAALEMKAKKKADIKAKAMKASESAGIEREVKRPKRKTKRTPKSKK